MTGVRRGAALVVVLALVGCTAQQPVEPAPPSATAAASAPAPASSSASSSATPSATVSSTATPTASPSPSASASASAVVALSCPSGASAAALRACVTRAVRVYVATWTRHLRDRGVSPITPPKVVLFTSPPTNPCIDLSESDAVEASFWCGKNWTIYVSVSAARQWTKAYAQAAKERGVLAADAAAAGTTAAALLRGYPLVGTTTELAHELGHWVQEVTGQRPWYDTRLASSSFAISNRATVLSELSADCMAGWVQGRAAADGTWVDTRIGAWAHHATMAELGGNIDEVRAGFRFPPENPRSIIGYGSAYSRIRLYDVGDAAGRAGKPGLSTCTAKVAALIGSSAPPSP